LINQLQKLFFSSFIQRGGDDNKRKNNKNKQIKTILKDIF